MAFVPTLIIKSLKQNKENETIKSKTNLQINQTQTSIKTVSSKPKEPKTPIPQEDEKPKEENQKKEPKKEEKTKEEKSLTEIDEAIILSEILEKDYKEKQNKAFLKQKKEAIKELTRPYQEVIKPNSFFLLGFKSIRNLFRMYKLNNSLILSRNLLNQSIPYLKVNYLTFLNKHLLRRETENITLENIYHVEKLKTDLIKTYGPLVKTDPSLITIMHNLDATYENLTYRYNELTKNKNAKVKKKQIFHN